MSKNSDPNTIPLVVGGKTYVILAYARMMKRPISKAQYKAFQLNKRRFTTKINSDFSYLVSKGLLESIHNGDETMYSITARGLSTLRNVARKRAMKERILLKSGKLKFQDAKFKHGDD